MDESTDECSAPVIQSRSKDMKLWGNIWDLNYTIIFKIHFYSSCILVSFLGPLKNNIFQIK